MASTPDTASLKLDCLLISYLVSRQGRVKSTLLELRISYLISKQARFKAVKSVLVSKCFQVIHVE